MIFWRYGSYTNTYFRINIHLKRINLLLDSMCVCSSTYSWTTSDLTFIVICIACTITWTLKYISQLNYDNCGYIPDFLRFVITTILLNCANIVITKKEKWANFSNAWNMPVHWTFQPNGKYQITQIMEL